MFLDRITPQATEGTVAEWLCEEGDEIKEGEDWVDIEAEKGVVPQNATQDFVVAKFLVEEKSGTFPLGTPIAITLDDIDDLAAFRAWNQREGAILNLGCQVLLVRSQPLLLIGSLQSLFGVGR